jgi:hypothetical protein
MVSVVCFCALGIQLSACAHAGVPARCDLSNRLRVMLCVFI